MRTPLKPSRRRVLGNLGASLGLPFLEDVASLFSSPSVAATVPQPVPAAAQTQAIGVLSGPAGTLPGYFMGLAYEKAILSQLVFTGENPSLAGLFNRLGNGVLSIAGNSVDQTLWTPGGLGNTVGEVSPVDVDNLAAFLALTNWKVLYGVNLAASTPALAAAEVAYVQAKLGPAVEAVHIGNEPDQYARSYFPQVWDGLTFRKLWEGFRSAIVTTTPSARIAGPATAGNVTNWTAPFALGPTGELISLLTQHYYRGNGQNVNATVENLVSPDPAIIANCVALQWAASARKIPFRISETNSYLYGGSPGVSDAYASALWVIDHLFHVALNGGSGVNMQGGDDGYYTPIANQGSTILQVRPEYYGLLFFSLAGQGTLLRTSLSVTNFNATMYAVLATSGVTNIILVNKEEYSSLRISIHCGRTIQSASVIELRSTALTATTGQTIQGGTVEMDGSITLAPPYAPENISSSWVTCYVPAISAVLLQVLTD